MLLTSYWMTRGPDTTFAQIALVGAGGGLIGGATVAWTLARTIGAWRRAMVAMVAAAGTAFVAVLTTAADMLGGPIGLVVLAALCLGVILVAYRVFLSAPRPS